MIKKLRSTLGMSLIEVLVVLGLVSLVGLGIASMMQNMLSAQKGVEQKNNIMLLHGEIFRSLSNSTACLNTFNDGTVFNRTAPSPTTVAPAQVTSAAGGVLYQVGQAYYNNTIRINSITLMNYAPDDAATNEYFGTARVAIVYQRVGNNIGLDTYTRDFRISLVLRKTGEQFQGAAVPAADNSKIRTCLSVSGANISDNYWTQVPGANAIYYLFNVGIGTTTPNTKFVVSNNANALPAPSTSNVATFANSNGLPTRVTIDSFGDGSVLTARRANGTAAAPSALLANDIIGVVNFLGYGTSGYGANARASIISKATENWSDAAQGTEIGFYTSTNGTALAVEKMTLKQDGNVGIGTTVPIQRFEVKANVASNYPMAILTSDFSTLTTGSRLVFGFGANTGDTYAMIKAQSAGSAAANNLILADAGGNVGIGTTAPTGALDVQAAVGRILVTATTGTNTAYFRSSNAAGQVYFGSDSSVGSISGVADATMIASTMAGPMIFTTNGFGAERMRIDNAGNVGIGSTVPTQKLHVVGNIGVTGNIFTTGNVGVGTNVPTQKLHVVGNVEVAGNLHSTGTMTADSDIRLKKNMYPLVGVLKKILQLSPIYFQWSVGDDHRFIGFSAQNVQSLFPELVETNANGFLAVNYMQMTAPIVAAIKELDEDNKKQDQQIEILKKENLALRAEIEEIKKILKIDI